MLVSPEEIRADQNAAVVYLSRLAPRSRRVMRQSLDVIAAIVTHGQMDAIELPWGELRYQHTAAIRAALADRYAPATANRTLSALRNVLKEAWRLGQMSAEEYHRAADLKNVRGERLPAGRALGGAEWQVLFESCAADEIKTRGVRDAALIAIAYGGGLRRAEVATLTVADFDRVHRTLRVRGKGNKERLTPLLGGCEEHIDQWFRVRGSDSGALICPVTKSGRIQIRHMSGQAIYNILLRRAELAGIEDFSPHDARRSFISDLLDAGADLSTVQKMAGHSNVATTARYDRRDDRAKHRAAALVQVPIIMTDRGVIA